jgi:hypothetical protein
MYLSYFQTEESGDIGVSQSTQSIALMSSLGEV